MIDDAEYVIIGAGITGLCAAFYLQRAAGADRVLVLEAAPVPGGTACTTRKNGFIAEHGPNGFLDREPLTLQWVQDLGLGDRNIRANAAAARRFIYKRGRLIELVPPPAFLKSPVLSLLGRARLLCEPLIPRKRHNAPESIWDFAARRIGREAADMLVAPMVSGIFGGDAKQLSLEHCFPRMAAMERDYGGLYKALRAKRRENANASAMGPGGTLTSFDDGLQTLVEVAASRLGDRLQRGVSVSAIRATARGFDIVVNGDEIVTARKAIVATPAYAAAGMLSDSDTEAALELAAIPYAGIVSIALGYRRDHIAHDLDGFGFLAPRNQGMRTLGCIWTSTLFPGRAPDGHVLLHAMIGGATDPEAARLTNDALLEIVQRELKPVLGIGGAPVFTNVVHWTRGIPQYTLQHGKHLEAIDQAEKDFPGLIFAGNAYRGVGLNDCVVSAHRAVKLALG